MTADDLDTAENIASFVRRSAPLDLSALEGLPQAPSEDGSSSDGPSDGAEGVPPGRGAA